MTKQEAFRMADEHKAKAIQIIAAGQAMMAAAVAMEDLAIEIGE